ANTCCRSAVSSRPARSASPAPPSRPPQRPKSSICCRGWRASTAAPTCNRNPARRASSMAEIVAPRNASTILLLRDSAGAKVDGKSREEIEVFMMVRHYEIDFNSGALVFPGGSVDKGDKDIIATSELYSGGEGLDEATLSFRIAAIRETFEESGILLARPLASKALVDAKRASEIEAAHRADLCDSKISFLKVLADNGMVLALDELVPYAHWITPEGMPKRFD